MSFATATATDHLDLLDRLKTFIESTITPPGERWTIERYTGIQEVLSSSALGGFEAFRAFQTPLIEGEEWRTAVGQATPSQIGCDLVTPVDVRRVIIQGVYTSFGGDATMNPIDFDLQWSDNGSAWTTLQSFTGGGYGNGGRVTFNVTAASPGAKRYWRINVTTNGGNANHTALQRLEFLTDETSAWFNHAEPVQMIARGPGLAAADEIYIGIQVYDRPSSDIYNWRLAAFTGYVPGNTFTTQPGNFGTPAGYPLWNLGTQYWLAANGQRIALVSKVETVYMTAYLGKILPYATPGQWPYPVAVVGMLPTDAATRYSDLAITGPWEGSGPRLRVRQPGGTWLQPECYPWANAQTIRDIPGGYGVVPVQLLDSDGVYGELDGVSHVSGFGTAVENLVDVGGTNHLVVQDVYRTGIRDYHALRLD